MKETKLINITFVALMFIGLFTSCSDNGDDESGNDRKDILKEIIGVWYAPNGEWEGCSFRNVYNFINSNTVIDYSTVSNSRKGWRDGCTEIPGHSGWYYGTGSERSYTYYIYDNKIYITNNKILTIGGEALYEDGSNGVYRKW